MVRVGHAGDARQDTSRVAGACREIVATGDVLGSVLRVIVGSTLVMGCGPAPERIGVAHQAILAGKPDATHAAVGVLRPEGSGFTPEHQCGATLVGGKTVLTAAHCLADANSATLRVELDSAIWIVAEARAHPDWDPSVSAYLNDIGLVRLRQAPGIAAMAVATEPPTVDMAVRLVGYGATAVGGPSSGDERHVGDKRVHRVGDDHFTIEGSQHNSADGDSGGPVLATRDEQEVLVGVISASIGSYELSYHVRVDRFTDWLNSTSRGDIVWAAHDRAEQHVYIPERHGCRITAGAPLGWIGLLWMAAACVAAAATKRRF